MDTTDPHVPPSGEPPPRDRRSAGGLLIWVLLLLALLAFGWFVYHQRAGMTDAPEAMDLPQPPAIDIGDPRDEAAERERADDDDRRRERRKAADAAPAPVSPPPPAESGPDREPVPLHQVEPDYPVAAYRDRQEGTVLVAVTVDPQGRPHDARVVRRSGSRELDAAAVDAVMRWTFDPAIRDGRPASAEVQVPVSFRIDR